MLEELLAELQPGSGVSNSLSLSRKNGKALPCKVITSELCIDQERALGIPDITLFLLLIHRGQVAALKFSLSCEIISDFSRRFGEF